MQYLNYMTWKVNTFWTRWRVIIAGRLWVSCEYLDSDVDNHVHREGGVSWRRRRNQGSGGFFQWLHSIKLTHVLFLGSHSWWRNTKKRLWMSDIQLSSAVQGTDQMVHRIWLQQTCIVSIHRSDGNSLQCFFQEVEQTGADDHFLWQSLEGHPGIQLGCLYTSTSLTFSCKDTWELKQQKPVLYVCSTLKVQLLDYKQRGISVI